MKKRLLSIALAMAMVLGLFPAMTLEAEAAAPSADAMSVFDAVGLKTDAPEKYNPNPEMKDTPFGKKFSTAAEVDELLILKQRASDTISLEYPFDRTLYGDGYFTKNPGEADGLEFLNQKMTGDELVMKTVHQEFYPGNPYPNYRIDQSDDSVVMMEANLDIRNNGMKRNAVVFGWDADKLNSSTLLLGAVQDPAHFEKGQLHPDWQDSHGNPKIPDWSVTPIAEREGLTIGNRDDYDENDKLRTGAAQKYAKLAVGDFDGDGLDEVAIYMPTFMDPHIAVYKMQRRTYGEFPKFELAWTYVLDKFNNEIPDMVSLVADDYNKDGMDDLVISYGNPCWSEVGENSRAVIMLGADQGKMLINHLDFELSFGNQSIERASFTSGDIDGDGYNELILGGNLTNEPADNRFVAVYKWTGAGFSRVSAENFDLFEKDDDGKRIHVNIADQNQYQSLPWLPANLAVGKFYGLTEEPCIYIDGIILQNGSEGLTVMDIVPQAKSSTYEWGVRAIDGVGNGRDLLVGNYWKASLGQSDLLKKTFREVSPIGFGKTSISANMTVVLNKCEAEGVKTRQTWTANDTQYQKNVLFCLPNVDNDTVIHEYTGEHYYSYSDPEVLAVLASPPYYQDLSNEEGGGMMESSTEYTAIQGSGSGTTRHGGFSAGVYTSYEYEAKILGVTIAKVEAEVEIQNSFTWDTQKMDSVEYETTYGTLAGQDTVALYSIPTEVYVYKAYIPNPDTGKLETSKMLVSIPHEPTVQTIPLTQYQEIREDYREILPEIGKNILSHQLGVPDSYPSSVMELPSGRRNTMISPGDPARLPTDGISYQKRAITMTKEEENSFEWDLNVSFKAGGGAGPITAGVTAGFNGGAGSMRMSTAGHSYSGQLMSAPASAGPCGYGFNWHLAAFQSRNGFPVVTYLVTDVVNPPLLPANFRVNEELTTTDQVALEWEFKGALSRFELYRLQKSSGGAEYYKIADVTARNATGTGTEDGTTYRYIDTNVRPNTEYKYRIRTVGISMPNLSIMSDPMAAYSKPDSDIPILQNNSSRVASYPDEPLVLKTTVSNKAELPAGASYYYQWQKQTSQGKWENIKNAITDTYLVNEPSREDAGVYRCKVNAMISSNMVNVFGEPITVTFDRRVSLIDLVTNQAGQKVEVSVRGEWNVTSVPNGHVELLLKGDRNYSLQMPLDSMGVARFDLSQVADGVYALSANYGGSRVFKPCATNSEMPKFFLKNVPSGETYLEVKEHYTYGDPLHIRIHTLNADGDSVSYEELGTPGHPLDLSVFEVKQDGRYVSIRNWINDVGMDRMYYDRLKSGVAGMVGEFRYGGKAFTVSPFQTSVTGLKSRYMCTNVDFDTFRDWLTKEIRDSGTIHMEVPAGMESDVKALNQAVISGPEIGALWIRDRLGAPLDISQKSYTTSIRVGEYEIYHRAASEPGIRSVLDNYDIDWGCAAELKVTQKTPGVRIKVTPAGTGTAEMIYPESSDRIPVGQRVTIKAYPAPGYTVKQISGGNTPATKIGEDTYTFTQQNEEATITVEFFIQSYPLDVIALPQYPTTDNQPVVNEIFAEGYVPGTAYHAGTEFTFGQKAASGWHFKGWEYRHGKEIVNSLEPDFQLTMPAEKATLYGKFARAGYRLELSDNLEAYAGSVRIRDLSSIPAGSQVTVQIAPGYFRSENAVWMLNGKEQPEAGSRLRFTMEEDTTVSLMVEQIQHAVAAEIRYIGDKGPDNRVTVTPEGPQPDGTAVTFRAETGAYHDFLHWENAAGKLVSKENPYTTTVDGETRLVAVLKEKEYTTMVLDYGLSYQINNGPYQVAEPIHYTDLDRANNYNNNIYDVVLPYEYVKLRPGDTINVKVTDGLGGIGRMEFVDEKGVTQQYDANKAYTWTIPESGGPKEIRVKRLDQEMAYGEMRRLKMKIETTNENIDYDNCYSLPFAAIRLYHKVPNSRVSYWIINGEKCFYGQETCIIPSYVPSIQVEVVTEPCVWHEVRVEIPANTDMVFLSDKGLPYVRDDRVFRIPDGEDILISFDPCNIPMDMRILSGAENAENWRIDTRHAEEGTTRRLLVSAENVKGDISLQMYSGNDCRNSGETSYATFKVEPSSNGYVQLYGRSEIDGKVTDHLVGGDTVVGDPEDYAGDQIFLLSRPDPGYATERIHLKVENYKTNSEHDLTEPVIRAGYWTLHTVTTTFVPTDKLPHAIKKGTSGNHGSFTIDRTKEIEGEYVALTYQLDEGYMVDQITVTGANGTVVKAIDIGGYAFFKMPDEDVRVDMTFRKQGWQYVYSGWAYGGHLEYVGRSGFGRAEAGEVITVRPVAREGFELTEITAYVNTVGSRYHWGYQDTIPVTDNKDGTYSFTMPEQYSVIVDPDFVMENQLHEIKISQPARGSIETDSLLVNAGQEVLLRVKADTGLEVGSVTVVTDGGKDVEVLAVPGEENTYRFVMPNDNVQVDAQIGKPLEISGRISVLDGSRDVTLKLYQNGVLFRTEILPGADVCYPREIPFTLSRVMDGTYDLIVEQQTTLPVTITNIKVQENVDLTTHRDTRISTISMVSGDVNGDGTVDRKDADVIKKPSNYLHYVNESTWDENGEVIKIVDGGADLNGDGEVNIVDYNIAMNEAHYLRIAADQVFSW